MLNKHNANKVLIVGAGIVGLSLARQLQKFNIPYRIIEKKNDWMPERDGIALPANAVRALRYMGLGEELETCAHRVNKIIYATPAGKILNAALLDQPPLDQDWFVALERNRLHEMLRTDIDNIQFGTTIDQIHLMEESVSVKFNYSSKRENFTLIVGADGINSRVRRLVFSDNRLIDLNVTAWRWLCEYDTNGLQPTYLLGAHDAFVAYPIASDKVYCYAQVVDREEIHSNCATTKNSLHECFSQYDGIVKKLLNVLPSDHHILRGRLRSFERSLFGKGRVALVGDAAHACSPMLQQGAASGFEDAIVLSEFLNEFSVTDAVSYYGEFRKERVNWTILASDGPMKKIINDVDEMAVIERNKRIRKDGPLIVLGWKTLLTTDPFLELQTFLAKHTNPTEIKEGEFLDRNILTA